MEIEKTPIASESTHWYQKSGAPQYTVIGKNGKERNATLRDARTMGLVPSVTAVLKVAAAPGLEKWKRDNILMAALTLPKIEGESLEDFAARVEIDAQDQANKARELGISIHASLEKAYLGHSVPDEHHIYVDAVQTAIEKNFGEFVQWSAEKSFASSLGYGGKIDLSSEVTPIVIDFKTSAFDDADKKKGYDENILQLVAYAEGLGMKDYRTANVFVSTSTPGLVKVIEHSKEEMETAWKKFLCLLTYWQLDKGYDPREA
jgi:hypothetical protein